MNKTDAWRSKRGALPREGLVRQPRTIRYPTLDRNYLAFTPRGVTSPTPYSQKSQASISVQPTPLRESFGRSNQRGSETSQASYGHSRGHLNLVRHFFLSLHLPVTGRLFLLPYSRSHKPATNPLGKLCLKKNQSGGKH